jgi:protein SCO1/2
MLTLATIAVVLLAGSARAQTAPPGLEGIEIVQHLDETIPADLVFRDETGQPVNLREISGGRPMILALVYYECPMLCTQVLTGLVQSLDVLEFNAGEQFDVVAVSIDPGETPDLAAAKKRSYVDRYGREGTEGGWHFLTGDEESIRRLAETVGFQYRYDPETDLFAHAAGIMIVTADGRLSRYFYGVEYPPRDVRLALIESSKNKIGTVVDQVILWCFPYNPATGKYSVAITRVIRGAGALTVLLLVVFIAGHRIREFRRTHRGVA